MKEMLKNIARRMTAPRTVAGNRPRNAPRTRLALESLENRWTPSCAIFTANAGKTLVIVGDNAANDVTLIQNDNANTLTAVCDGGAPQVFTSTAITKIRVDLQDGHDDLWYGLASGVNFKFAKQADLKLGAGDDTVTIDMWQGIGVPSFISSNLNIALDAGIDNDEVDADFGGKRGGILTFQANMNTGDDVCRARMWGDLGAGAIVLFDLHGGGGNDTLGSWNTYDNAVPGYNSIDVPAGCEFTIGLKGGAGQDDLFLTYSGKVAGRLNIVLDGGEDSDHLSASKSKGSGIYLQPGSTGVLDALFLGGGGNDPIEMEVYDSSGGLALADALADGGTGNDHLKRTANVLSVNNEAITTV
jgi:hypothetical protein